MGAADRSYGIHVAKLAGLPAPVLSRANEVLSALEKADGRPKPADLASDLPLFKAATGTADPEASPAPRLEKAPSALRVHSGKEPALRVALVELLRRLVDEARTAAKRQLEEDGDGRACAAGLSAF